MRDKFIYTVLFSLEERQTQFKKGLSYYAF